MENNLSLAELFAQHLDEITDGVTQEVIAQSGGHYASLDFAELRPRVKLGMEAFQHSLAEGSPDPYAAFFAQASARRAREGYGIEEMESAIVATSSVIMPFVGHHYAGTPPDTLAKNINLAARIHLGGMAQIFATFVTVRNETIAAQQKQLERRARQIAAGADIARVATTILEPDLLIAKIVGLIHEQFGLYYAGLFLIDAEKRYAVLQHGVGTGSASEAGRIMKERGHRLEIGGQSMIGWACANGQARIALDVGQEAIRFANPLTPETRSEMALPLRAGERVIGALTVQSTQASAFDEGDIAALQGMTDQIAVALENARLFQQTQTTLKELESTNRLMMRQGWQGYLEQRATMRRVELDKASGAPGTGPLATPLTIPLELRGQPLGKVTLRRGGDRPWSNDEIELVQAIAVQTSLAADNARLMEQTQAALQETEGLFQAAQAITGTAHIQEICQALSQQSNDLLQADRTLVFLIDQARERILFRAGQGNLADDLETTYAELCSGLTGVVLKSGQPILSTSADDGLEPAQTRERRQAAGTGAVVVAPLVIKGQVIGSITAINRMDQRKFTQHDVDLLMALTAQGAPAIESQRLFEETQRRAEREQLIRQVTTRIRAAADIEGVLQATATELARSMGVPRAIVRLAMGNAKTSQDGVPHSGNENQSDSQS